MSGSLKGKIDEFGVEEEKIDSKITFLLEHHTKIQSGVGCGIVTVENIRDCIEDFDIGTNYLYQA